MADGVTVTPSWDPKTATYRDDDGLGYRRPHGSPSLRPSRRHSSGWPSAGTAAPADLPSPETVAAEGWVYVDPKSYSDPYAHAPVYTSGQQPAPPAPGAPGPAHPPSSLHGVPGSHRSPIRRRRSGARGARAMPTARQRTTARVATWPGRRGVRRDGRAPQWPARSQAPDPTSAYPEPSRRPCTELHHPRIRTCGPGSGAPEGWVADPAYGTRRGLLLLACTAATLRTSGKLPAGQAGGTAVAPAPGLVPIPAVTEGWSPSAPGMPPPPVGLYQGVVPPVAATPDRRAALRPGEGRPQVQGSSVLENVAAGAGSHCRLRRRHVVQRQHGLVIGIGKRQR